MNRPGAAAVSVGVLGAVRVVSGDGASVAVPSATQRRLLAVLALHSPRPVRSEFLAEALDLSPGALRTGVSRLRATVGTTGLETATTGYAWVGDVDAARFCRALADAANADLAERAGALQRALELWSGPPLEEFVGEPWADGEIARLTEIHGGAVDDLADALIETRRAAEAVALLAAQITRYPYRDRSRGLLIRALASAGRQADALRAFQDYRTLLIEASGIEPSPEVVRIERRVATGWDGLETTPGDPSDLAVVVDEPVALPLPSVLDAIRGLRRPRHGTGNARAPARAGRGDRPAVRRDRRRSRDREDRAPRRVRSRIGCIGNCDCRVRNLRRDRRLAPTVP